jgi:hypothetical protein
MNKFKIALGILAAAGSFCLKAHADHDSTPGTKVRFVDNCTGEETATTSPNGVSIAVDIEQLDRLKPLWIELQVGPPEQPDGSHIFSTYKLKKIYYPNDHKFLRHLRIGPSSLEDVVDDKGHFHLKKHLTVKHRDDKLLKNPENRVWVARLRWTQSGMENLNLGKGGSGGAWIYLLESTGDRFYRAVRPSVCSWQTPIQIQSEYRYNSDIDDMHLTSKTKWFEVQGNKRGVAAGLLRNQNFGGIAAGGHQNYNPNPMLMNPGAVPGGVAGWYFKHWKTVSATRGSTQVSRTWVMGTDQGGFFGTRYHFDRIPVEEYALEKKGIFECAKWNVVRRGYLDVGFQETDFYIVPKSMASQSEIASEFVQKLSPPVNNCFGLRNLHKGQPEFRLPDSGDGMQYFYPTSITQEF